MVEEPVILAVIVVVFLSEAQAATMLQKLSMFALDGNIPSVLAVRGLVQNLIPVTQAWAVVRS